MHVVKKSRVTKTAARGLGKVAPTPKCDSWNVYLQKGVCRKL